VERRLRELLADAQRGQPMTVAQTLEIAQCYRELGNGEQAARVLESLAGAEGLSWRELLEVGVQLAEGRRADASAKMLDRLMGQPLPPDFPADAFVRVARAYEQCGLPGKMVAPLMRFLQARPTDWRAWITLAAAYQRLGQTDRAAGALRRAQELGRAQAMQAAYQVPELRPLFQQAAPGGQPGGGLGLPGFPR